MSEFIIFDASQAQDCRDWLGIWEAGTDREVFAHPAYSALFTNPDHKILCAYFHDDGGEVLFPFTLREVSRESWASDIAPCWDLVSPYGYGGPYKMGSPSAAGFWEAFTQWAKTSSVVSGFLRRGLFPEQLVPLPEGELEIAQNIVRTLEAPIEALLKDYEHKVRKNINKATRNHLTCRPDPEWKHLKEFFEIYCSTMDRRNASDFYLFEKSFFERIHRDLPNNALLFHIHNADDRIISTELVLISTRNIYSFLGGTLPEGFKVAANDLLKHAIIEWGHQHGKENFVLGGGFRPGDGIFLYKKAFAPEGIRPFTAGKLIWDPGVFQQLVDSRRIWEASLGRNWEPDPGFFPTFRAPTMAPPVIHP